MGTQVLVLMSLGNCSAYGSAVIVLSLEGVIVWPPQNSGDPMKISRALHQLLPPPACSVLSVLAVLTSPDFHLWRFNSERLLSSAWVSLLCASLDFTSRQKAWDRVGLTSFIPSSPELPASQGQPSILSSYPVVSDKSAWEDGLMLSGQEAEDSILHWSRSRQFCPLVVLTF